MPVPTLQVSVPIGHELLGQCIKQGQALVQRASLVGDFSDYESWKSARKQWIDPTVQALEHMYGGQREAREFADAATPPEGSSKRWQEQYGADLKCVEEAIGLLTVLRGELAFTGREQAGGTAELQAGELRTGELRTGELRTGELQAGELQAGELQPTGGAASTSAATVGPRPLGERTIDREQVHSNGMPEQPANEREAPSGGSFSAPSNGNAEESGAGVGAELTPAQHVGSQLAHHAGGTAPAELDPTGGAAPAPARTRQVLLAHGRDERWRQAVEHLLEQAGEHEIRIINQRSGEHGRLADALDDEQAPSSRYAIVLLTADDIGGPRLESDMEPFFSTRPHQEVVFQMGFLVAALSPGRVCVLYEDGVELPYDLEGVLHVRLDLAGTWQPKLLLHLRRAGFDYDMNKLVQV